MESSIERDRFWQERQRLARYHQQLIQQERLVRRMGRSTPPVPKRTWKSEMQLLRAELKQHLREAALQLWRELLKIQSKRLTIRRYRRNRGAFTSH